MQVLVARGTACGCGRGVLDGELATVLTVRRDVDAGRGGWPRTVDVDHVLGLESGHLASAAEVVAIAVPREVVVDCVVEALAARDVCGGTGLTDLAEALADEMLRVAGRHALGTRLEAGPDGRLRAFDPPGSAPPQRTRGRRSACGGGRRGA